MYSNKGFTLLEVLISFAIMAIIISAAILVASGALNATGKARTNSQVAIVAKNVMIETEIELAGTPLKLAKKEESGEVIFKNPEQVFIWKREIKEVKFPDLNFGGGQGEDGESKEESPLQGKISQTITEFLSKAIREIVITIYWEKGEGQQSFVVTTYWVDLNYEFKINL